MWASNYSERKKCWGHRNVTERLTFLFHLNEAGKDSVSAFSQRESRGLSRNLFNYVLGSKTRIFLRKEEQRKRQLETRQDSLYFTWDGKTNCYLDWSTVLFV